MRKIIFILVVMTTSVAIGQIPNPPSIVSVSVAPSGSCASGLPNQQVISTGVQYSCQGGTWAAISGGGGSLPNSTNFPQGPVYYSSGTGTTTPTTYGADVLPLSGGTIDANGSRSSTYGEIHLGDSISAGVGATAAANGMASLLDQYTNAGPTFTIGNTAVSGDKASDNIVRALNFISPADNGNPIIVGMVGTNDTGSGTGAGALTAFRQYLMGMDTWDDISSTNKSLVNTAAWTASGGWGADTTFAQANGLTTTTTGSTLTNTTCTVGPSGVMYVWAYAYTTSNSTWSLSVDGTPQTDTITGLTNVSAQIQADPPNNVSSPVAVGARYAGISQGTHTCVITTTQTSGTVGIIAAGFPSAVRNRNLGTLRAGVPYQLADANSAATAAYNAEVLNDVIQLANDGLNEKFVNVRAYLDFNLDFTGTLTQNCPASTNVGVHPNNCGHMHLYQAFADAMKSGTIIPVNSITPTSAKFYAFNPTGCQGTTTTLCYGDTFFVTASAEIGDTFTRVNNTSNAGLGAPEGYAVARFYGGNSITTGATFCSTSTFPLAQENQLTCLLHMFQNAFYLTPLSAATSGLNVASSFIDFRGSGWSGSAAQNDDYQISDAFTTGGSTGNSWFQVKNTTAGTTGQRGIAVLNSSGFGFELRADGETTADAGYPAFGIKFPLATATFAVGTNVTSVACAVGYLCNNTRGTLTIVGGTATTGTIATVSFSATLNAVPQCFVTQNGGTTFFGIGNNAPSTSSFVITAGVTVTGATLTVNYQCAP